MANIIHTTFWNYNSFKDYKPEMLRDWIELGITTPILPMFNMGSDSHEALTAILDDAQSLGIQVILQINTVFLDGYKKGEDAYRAAVTEAHNEFGRHPAVYGFYVGEEPSTESEKSYMEGVRIIKEVAPEACVYINFGSIERTDRMMLKGERSIDDWVCDFAEHTGSNVIGYGTYSQLFRDNTGAYEHFHNLRTFVEAGKKAGADVWATMLSSAHDYYRVPTEDDFRWQLNTCIACGCKAVVWFRLYDKLVAFDYRGSPIDEFGVKTQRFYDLARVQKKFNIHYGNVFSRLKHIDSYGVGISYGGYSYFVPGTASDLIDAADCRSGMISFFKDEDGTDYIAVLNIDMVNSYHMTLTFSEKVQRADLVYYGGDMLINHFDRGDRKGSCRGGAMCLAPGHMEVMKLTLAE